MGKLYHWPPTFSLDPCGFGRQLARLFVAGLAKVACATLASSEAAFSSQGPLLTQGSRGGSFLTFSGCSVSD